MFRMWGKAFKNSRMLKDTVVIMDQTDMTRTQKVYR